MTRTEHDLLNALTLGEAEAPNADAVYAGVRRRVRVRRRSRALGAGVVAAVAVLGVALLPALLGIGPWASGAQRDAAGPALLRGKADDVERGRQLAVLAGDAAGLVHELQNEAAAAALLLAERANQTSTQHESASAFDRQASVTETSERGYRARRGALADPPEIIKNLLGKVDEQVAELPRVREKVRTGVDASLAPVLLAYRVLITNLMEIRSTAAQFAGDENLGADIRAAAAIAQAKECLAQERVVGLRALVQGRMPAELRREYIETRACRDLAERQFDIVANEWQMSLFNTKVTGSDEREAALFEGAFDAMRTEELRPTVDFTTSQWDAVMVGRASLYREVESAIDERIVTDADALRAATRRDTYVNTGVLAGAFVLAVTLALVGGWWLGRRRRAPA